MAGHVPGRTYKLEGGSQGVCGDVAVEGGLWVGRGWTGGGGGGTLLGGLRRVMGGRGREETYVHSPGLC